MRFINKFKILLKYYYFKYKYNIEIAGNGRIGNNCNIKVKNQKLGLNTTIGNNCWIEEIKNYFNYIYDGRIKIGNNVNIGNYACITAIDKVVIGDWCLLSEHVYITDHFHGHNPNDGPIIKQALYSKGPTIIGDSTFIGYRVSILSGVEIGNNCIIGSHSVVTKSFEPYSMIVGSPAKLIKKFDHEENKWVSV
jgi:lipopolysaccharide O-acetyltransferase